MEKPSLHDSSPIKVWLQHPFLLLLYSSQQQGVKAVMLMMFITPASKWRAVFSLLGNGFVSQEVSNLGRLVVLLSLQHRESFRGGMFIVS